MRSFHLPFLLAAVTLAAGCPKQSTSTAAAESEPAPTQKSRFSGDTGAFVDALLSNGIVGYDVAADGASVVYDSMKLTEDGSFEAATSLRLGEDPFSCTETGTWALDDDTAVSVTEAMVTFDMTSSDCPGREAPKTWRAKLEISGKDVVVSQF